MSPHRAYPVGVSIALCLLFLAAFPSPTQAESVGSRSLRVSTSAGTSAQSNCGALAFEFVGNATIVSLGDWTVLNQTVFNSCVGNTDVVMFAVWKITSGQTVAVETAGAYMTARETLNFYVPVYNIAPGTYTVFLFGVSESNNVPVSLAERVEVTLV